MPVSHAVNSVSLIIAVILFTLPGCGGDSDSVPTASTSTETATPPSEHDAAGEHDAPGAHDAEMEGMAGMQETAMPSESPGPHDAEMSSSDDSSMMETDPAMMSEYQTESGGGYGGPTTHVQPSRPADVALWSDTDLIAAVAERDAMVLNAIHVKAEASEGDPAFVGLMTDVLVANSGGGTVRIPGEPGFPRGFDPAELQDSDAEPLVPPGGESLEVQPLRVPALKNRALTSLEVMVGQSLLGFAPQAVQGIRGSAERMQDTVNQTETEMSGQMPPGSPVRSDAEYDATMNGDSEMNGEYDSSSEQSQVYSNRAQGSLTDEELLRGVIQGLIINNSDPAWQALLSIQKGKIPSPLSKKQRAEILVRTVCEAPTVNTDAAANIIAEGVKLALAKADEPQLLKLLTVVGGVATDHFLQLSNPPAPSDAPAAAGMANNLTDASGAAGMTDAMMESNMLDGSSEDFGSNPNFAAGGRAKASSNLPVVDVSPVSLLPVATSLWMPAQIDAISAFLDNADASASLDLLALATVIPSDKVRHSIYELFDRLHEQGASGMVQSGLFSSVAKDPGLLTVLKALPRSRGQKSTSRGAETVVDPKESWSDASFDLVVSLRDRLRNVASNPALRYEGSQPVVLHGGRSTIPEITIAIESLAADAKSLGDSQPSPTSIYYTKLTISPASAREAEDITEHYEKRSNGEKRINPGQGVLLWLDGVKKNSDGTRQSMDVIIEQAKANAGGFNPSPDVGNTIGGGAPQQQAGAAGQRFTIEIIVVKTRDPKEAPAKSDVAGR